MTKRLLSTLLFVAVPSTVLPATALAGSLTIKGTDDLKFSSSGDTITLEGTYSIENAGDETAKEVFPSLQIGTWTWAGTPKTLEQSKSETWTLAEKIPASALSCMDKSACVDLPLKGAAPMLIRRHYQDLNGYRFSAADVEVVEFGEIGGNGAAAVRAPELDAKLKFEGDGQAFVGTVEILNSAPSEKKVAVNLHTSRELKVLSKQQLVTVPAGGSANVGVSVENFRGLAGSTYAAFAVLEWEESGIRNALQVSGLIRIEERKRGGDFLLAGLGVLALLGVMVYVAVFRKRESAQPSK